VQALGDAVLAGLAGGADVGAPGVLEHPLLEVGDHRLVRGDRAGQEQPVRLVEALERRARAVARARRVGQRDGLAVGAAVLVEAHDALEGGVEQVGVRALGDDDVQRAVGELLDLLDGDGEQRDVRVAHRPADGVAVGVEAVAADRALGVQLDEA
jgi:hypothetical protein